MLTRTDISNLVKELGKTFATKDELEKTTDNIKKYVDARFETLEYRLEPLKKFENIIEETNHKIVEFKDQILGELASLRDEVTITVGYRDLLENHEERIHRLEKSKELKGLRDE